MTAVYQLCVADISLGSVEEIKLSAGTKTNQHNIYVTVKSSLVPSSASSQSVSSTGHLLYRVSQEECARLPEGVPYVKVYRYNPKHLCPNLNGYGDNGQRSLKL